MKKDFLGSYIQNIRLNKKISQKKLSNGICSVAQLSRYETGQRFPRKIMFDTLIERLGESSKSYNYLSNYTDCLQSNYRKNLIYLSFINDLDNIDFYLEKYKNSSNKLDLLDKQFISFIETSKLPSNEEKLKQYTTTIKMTIPNFEIANINDYLLSNTEIQIINSIACCHKSLNNTNIALDIFNKLAHYVDNNISSNFEKLKNKTLITSNLTNLLLANKQYNKALYWTNKGIDLCIENNNSFFLPVLYHSKYKALIKMGNISEAKKIAIYVYTLFKVNGQTNLAKLVLNDFKKYNISFDYSIKS